MATLLNPLGPPLQRKREYGALGEIFETENIVYCSTTWYHRGRVHKRISSGHTFIHFGFSLYWWPCYVLWHGAWVLYSLHPLWTLQAEPHGLAVMVRVPPPTPPQNAPLFHGFTVGFEGSTEG